MSYVTQAELVEIVPDLRAMALVETCLDVCAALNRLADRYAAMADECQDPTSVRPAHAYTDLAPSLRSPSLTSPTLATPSLATRGQFNTRPARRSPSEPRAR